MDEDHNIDDDAYDPEANKPKSSKKWLSMLADADKAGQQDYDDRCDNIDKRFADMERLANVGRDREFQIFWANIQVLGPSVYARPPVPVVAPRPWVKGEKARTASALMERSAIVSQEIGDIDGLMRQLRDDLIVSARAVSWLRYEKADSDAPDRVCYEHVNRKDFRHDPARNWSEVDWVGKASYLTRGAMRKRFHRHSGDAYKDAAYARQKDDKGLDDGKEKARVWEIWSKSLSKVVWVTEGVDVCLDEGDPHLDLEGFFPCPKPAYGTVQRNTLIPVPDFLFYKDQIEEINELTARIAALSDSLQLRGFYPAGAGEIGDAVEQALKTKENRQVLIGVADWAMLGTGGAKDMIVWLPLDMVVQTIQALVELRRQLIEDVYQITGLSDIMRGSTVASETLGAQELKSQYGSIRIRDKQYELVRIARDITRIGCEIMAEEFSGQVLMDMSQTELPSDSDIAQQVKMLEQQARTTQQELEQAQQDPEIVAMAQKNPEQAQKAIAEAQKQVEQIIAQIEQVQETVTIDQVMDLLRAQKMRPFVLEIETDSTIAPDENAQKQRATEFLTATGGFLEQGVTLVSAAPESAEMVAEMLKYVANQFRAGRELQGVIEDFADKVAQRAAQAQGQQKPDPELIKAQGQAKRDAAEAKRVEAEALEKASKSEQDLIAARSKAEDEAVERDRKKQEISDSAALAVIQRQTAQEEGQRKITLLDRQITKTEAETVKVQSKPDPQPSVPAR